MPATRGLRLAEALLELAPQRRRELWQRLALGLHRAQPSIAVVGLSTPVPVQLIERVDLVMVAVPVSRVARAMARLYHELVAEIFRRGAADEIAATYYDSEVRGRAPVSLEHWRGRPRPELGDVFMFDMGERQGWDRGRWYEPGMELYTLEPPDPRLDPDRNALLPWPGLILPDILVLVNDGAGKVQRGRPPLPVWGDIKQDVFDYLLQQGVPEPGDGKFDALGSHIKELCRRRGQHPAPETIRAHALDYIIAFLAKPS
jgi:hypothetical protein